MKKICILLLLALCSLATVAQIHLTPYVISDVQGTSERTNSVLENKLRTLLAANNVLSKFGDSRFILAAKFDVLDKEIVSSAPIAGCLQYSSTFRNRRWRIGYLLWSRDL